MMIKSQWNPGVKYFCSLQLSSKWGYFLWGFPLTIWILLGSHDGIRMHPENTSSFSFRTVYVSLSLSLCNGAILAFPQRIPCIYIYIWFSGWWFQPIWKILYSQNGNLPQVGVKIKKNWNHHLFLLNRVKACFSRLIFKYLSSLLVSMSLAPWLKQVGRNPGHLWSASKIPKLFWEPQGSWNKSSKMMVQLVKVIRPGKWLKMNKLVHIEPLNHQSLLYKFWMNKHTDFVAEVYTGSTWRAWSLSCRRYGTSGLLL